MYDDLSRPPLNQRALVQALVTAGSRWTDLRVVPSTASTNAVLSDQARAGAEDGTVLIAEHQSAGRGRLDRSWSAPPRAGITMSVLVRLPQVPAIRWTWLPLLAGLAVGAAVQQVAQVPARLKWPNDVVVDDRKLAGLLLERVDTSGRPAAVIGMGINVSTTRAELPTPTATSLLLEGAATTDRTTLVKAVLRRLDGLLADWERSAGQPNVALERAYAHACSTLGQQVRIELPDGRSVSGQAVDIDDSGRLVVQTESDRRVFAAGDVQHVRRLA